MNRITGKILLSCILLIVGVSNVFSQLKWDSLVGGKFQWSNAVSVMYADSNYLYVAGGFNEIGGRHMQGIARWNGRQWDSLGTGLDGLTYLTGNSLPANNYAITAYNNKMYICGQFSSLGNVAAVGLGSWDGNQWDSLPVQPLVAGTTLFADSNKLYLGGEFTTVDNIPAIGIAYWDGSHWNSMNFPTNFSFRSINSICEYNGSIYVGGSFSGDDGGIGDVLRYDSTGWHSVDTGIKGTSTLVKSMVVYNGALYVAGFFSKSDGNAGNNIQRWNGTQWSDVGGGTDWEIYNLMVFNNKLYAMGDFYNAGGVPASSIAEWDGSKWCGLGDTFDNGVGTSCIYKDTLYIGGGFWTINADSISYIAKWAGGNYVDTCGNDATGVSEPIANNGEEISVYPNPTSGNVTIALKMEEQEDVEFILYNLFGEPVYSERTHEPAGIINKQISLSSLPNGNYILAVRAGNNIYHSKITKLQ